VNGARPAATHRLSDGLAIWLAIWLASVCTALPCAQGGAGERGPEVRQKLAAFTEAVADKKMARDQEAVRIVDELVAGLDGMEENDRQAFADALESVFEMKKRKADQDGLYRAVVFALGSIGGERSSRFLVKVLEAEPFRRKQWIDLQEVLLESIGRTGDEKQIVFLRRRATTDQEDRIKAAAGQALGHFAGAKLEVKKDIVTALIADYGRIEGDSKGDPGTPTTETRKKTLRAIRAPWNATLGKLTGQKLETAKEWQDWWNQHKDDKDAWSGAGAGR